MVQHASQQLSTLRWARGSTTEPCWRQKQEVESQSTGKEQRGYSQTSLIPTWTHSLFGKKQLARLWERLLVCMPSWTVGLDYISHNAPWNPAMHDGKCSSAGANSDIADLSKLSSACTPNGGGNHC